MSYRIGDVEMQGSEPQHTNIIRAVFTPKVVDGGKARIKTRRDRLFSRDVEAGDDRAPCEMNPV